MTEQNHFKTTIFLQRKNSMRMLLFFTWLAWPFSTIVVGADKSIVVESAILKTIESTAVSAEVAGVIANLTIKEGSEIRSGDEVGRIKDAGIQLQTERAKKAFDLANKKNVTTIDFRISEKNVALARNEHTRALNANKKVSGTYPVSEVDHLLFVLERSILESERATYQKGITDTELAIAEIEYRQSVELWKRHIITAPCDGMVVSVEKRKGEWVEPGSVVLKIVQTSRLRIEGLVSAKQASTLKVGQLASVEPVGENGSKSEAKLVFVSPEVNPIDSQVKIFLEVDNASQKWRPGFRPKVVFN